MFFYFRHNYSPCLIGINSSVYQLNNPKPTNIKTPNHTIPLIKKNVKPPTNKYLPYLFLSRISLVLLTKVIFLN
tara:strand:+ start:395 stop:616 length:222 start_codon:yes stop_codon:yes gene_type:complete